MFSVSRSGSGRPPSSIPLTYSPGAWLLRGCYPGWSMLWRNCIPWLGSVGRLKKILAFLTVRNAQLVNALPSPDGLLRQSHKVGSRFADRTKTCALGSVSLGRNKGCCLFLGLSFRGNGSSDNYLDSHVVPPHGIIAYEISGWMNTRLHLGLILWHYIASSLL